MNAHFQKKLQQISKDKNQMAAYQSVNNTVVLAGPGSGKTTVLTLKVIHLLNDVISSPRGLACLTYNNETVREFQKRLTKLGMEYRKNVFLGTVHSFCLSEIIMPFASVYPQYGIPLPIRIISENEKSQLFESQNYEGNPKLIDVDKERNRNIKGLSNVLLDSYEVALNAAVSFEQLLLQKGYIDFISMVKIAVDLIRNESYVRHALEAKFPWIVIDEYQDLGKPLHELILTLLDMTNIKIFAVGDADQSIYGFQGAAPDYLEELSARSDVSSIRLTKNYRSSQGIVDASEYILKTSRGYVASGETSNYRATLKFIACESGMFEQYKEAITLIEKYHEDGIAYHEIAVLLGTNHQVSDLEHECTQKGIPVYTIRNEFRTTDLICWLQSCAKWVLDKHTVSFNEICSIWKSFISDKQILTQCEYLQLRKDLLSILKASSAYRNDLSQWLHFLNDKMSIIDVFKHSERYPDEVENFNNLITFVSKDSNGLSINYLSKLGVPENQVVLTTRHSSKGLEFDVVVMLGMEKDSFPNYYDNTQTKLDEARRLCFVSVSRARKACILIRSKHLPYTNKKTGITTWYPKDPSPFWVELQKFQNSRTN